jgi:hypothetical protein
MIIQGLEIKLLGFLIRPIPPSLVFSRKIVDSINSGSAGDKLHLSSIVPAYFVCWKVAKESYISMDFMFHVRKP